MTEEKKKTKLKSLSRFHSANEINNYNRLGGKEKKKKIQRVYRTSQNMKVINVFLESLLSESSPSLGVPVHLTSLGRPPTLCWSLYLLWGQLRFSSGPTVLCSCLQWPQLSGLVRFLLWELSMIFYIFHRHRVCLVDRVDLICSLYSWWEGIGSSSLVTLCLGFNCGFISTSACGSSTGVCSWGCPAEGTEVVHLLGLQGFWRHQVLRGAGG